MIKKKICFIAQFPPPIHGLSKAIETLYDSELSSIFEFEKINITDNKRFLINLIKIIKSKGDLFYFTISQTRGGNLRDLVILKVLKIQRKRCLIHLHGGYYRELVEHDLPKWQRKANYKAMKTVAGGIVLGETLKNIFQGMIPEEKIYIVKNCVDDMYLMKRNQFDRKIQRMNKTNIKHVLYLSNMIKSKGYQKVLEMAKLEKERYLVGEKRNFHFDFAGLFFDKKEEKGFLSYIKQNDLQEYVTYYGKVTGEEKRKLLKKGSIFVLLTCYPKEGQPISILEAMGNGMMIITTNHAGIPDVVKNHDNGLLVPKDTPIELVFQEMLSLGQEEVEEICCYNYNYAKKNFSQKCYINHMKHIFETVR